MTLDRIDQLIIEVLQEKPNWTFNSKQISRAIERTRNKIISPSRIAGHMQHISDRIEKEEISWTKYRIRVKIKA